MLKCKSRAKIRLKYSVQLSNIFYLTISFFNLEPEIARNEIIETKKALPFQQAYEPSKKKKGKK